MKLSKLFLPAMILVVILIIYFSYFAPSAELGLFSKFSNGSEINQTINVLIIKESGIGKNANGDIVSFKAKDKNGVIANINLHEPGPEGLGNAKIVELLGHMHDNNFSASRITVIK